MKAKFIVIEGTDSSGKETQAKLLVENLIKNNIEAVYQTFPMYNTPTGKIIGGPYLGKESICEGWFLEKASNVPPLVASLYYAADRKYNIDIIKKYLENGITVVLDRYVDSNLAHQSAKMKDKKERLKFYKKIEDLEYKILDLIKPDATIFLHLPYKESVKSMEVRMEKKDQHESSVEHLKNAELSYLEIAKLHEYITIDCMKDENNRKNIDELQTEVYEVSQKILKR